MEVRRVLLAVPLKENVRRIGEFEQIKGEPCIVGALYVRMKLVVRKYLLLGFFIKVTIIVIFVVSVVISCLF